MTCWDADYEKADRATIGGSSMGMKRPTMRLQNPNADRLSEAVARASDRLLEALEAEKKLNCNPGLTLADAQATRETVDGLAQDYLKAMSEYVQFFRDVDDEQN